MDRSMTGRVAIVTGASSGIGAAIAESFAAAGATVWMAARDGRRLDGAAADLRGRLPDARIAARPTDVTDEAQVKALFEAVLAADGRVDVLVNNAGAAVAAPSDQLSLADWKRVLDVNLTGAFLCAREALRIMKGQGGGRILNIGSISAKVPRANSAAYTASKFGLEGLTRAFALDGRPHGVAVGVLQPGNTESGIWTGREAQARQEGIMPASEVARVALAMVTLPADINLLEAVVLPVSMPFLGRG